MKKVSKSKRLAQGICVVWVVCGFSLLAAIIMMIANLYDYGTFLAWAHFGINLLIPFGISSGVVGFLRIFGVFDDENF